MTIRSPRVRRRLPQAVEDVQPEPVLSLEKAEPESAFEARPSGLTIELWLYAAICLLALTLRIGSAAWAQLGPDEAGNALDALTVARGNPVAGMAPLSNVITGILFFVIGPSDLAGRFVSVLAGTALVGMMYALRGVIGRATALIAAFLLAISPVVLKTGARVDAEALSVLCFAVAIWSLFALNKVDRVADRRLWLTLGGSLGLLLASGPRAVTYILVLVLFFAILRAMGRTSAFGPIADFVRLPAARETLLFAAGLLSLLYVVVTTRMFLLLAPPGLPALSASLAELNSGQPNGPLMSLLGLVLYEPLIFCFGMYGLVRFVMHPPRDERSRLFLMFISVWFGLALVLTVLGGQRTVGPLTAVVIPATLLAATALTGTLRRLHRDDLSRAAALLGVVPLLVFSYIVSAQLTRADATPAGGQWLAVGLSLLLTVGYLLLLAFATGPGMGTVVTSGISFLLLLATFHSAWWLNAGPPVGEWILPVAPGPGARLITRQALDLSKSRGGASVGVSPSLREPFAWTLRDIPDLVMTDALLDGQNIIVLPEGAPVSAEQSLKSFRSTYAITPMPPTTVKSFWRWYVFRELDTVGSSKNAVLFFRDLLR